MKGRPPMETATPQDRLDAIQSRLTTISGLAAELAASADAGTELAALRVELDAARQDLERMRSRATSLEVAAYDVLRAVDRLGPQGELLTTGVLEAVGSTLTQLDNTMKGKKS